MAIDKSIRADYAIQGGGPNYLGKQEMVKAPKKWKSSPDHEPAELAYITEKEKDILIDLDIYGSLNGKPNRGPSGIISLQGDLGGYDASPSRGGGGNGHAHPGIASTYSPPAPTVTRSRIQEEKQAQKNIDDAARVREILTRGRGTEIPGERLFEDRISKGATPEIKAEVGPDGQIVGREYNAEAIQKAAKKESVARALGIGDPLTGEQITSLPTSTRIADFVPTQTRIQNLQDAGSKFLPSLTKEGMTEWGKEKAKSWLTKKAVGLGAKELGITGFLPQAIIPWGLSKIFGGKKDPLRTVKKQIAKFNRPIFNTQNQNKKRTFNEPTGDGNNVQRVSTGKDAVTESIKKYTGISDTQKAEAFKRRGTVENILKQGSYQGKQLTNQQRNTLMNYVSQIDKYLVAV